MSRKLDPESSNVFRNLCNRLLQSETTDAYDKVKSEMDSFIDETKERAYLKSWLAWWHDRRGFIFRAFAPNASPPMNQAEVVHAGWVHRDPPNMSLLDACQADARDSITLNVEIKVFEQGSATGGTGPSNADRQRKKHKEQVKRTKQLGQDMFLSTEQESGYKIDPKSKHRPRKTATSSSKVSQTITTSTLTSNIAVTPSSLPPSTVHCSSSIAYPTHLAVDISPSVIRASTSLPSSSTHLTNPSIFSATGLMHPGLSSAPSAPHQHLPVYVPPNIASSSLAFQPSSLTPTIPPLQWHSGMFPYPYELVPLPAKAQKCYGCGNTFANKFRSPPLNIVVRHMDRRVIRRNEHTGQLVYSSDYGNTYYHPHLAHIKRKNPLFTRLVSVSSTLYNDLDTATKAVLDSYEFNVIMKP